MRRNELVVAAAFTVWLALVTLVFLAWASTATSSFCGMPDGCWWPA